jgi:hypothetical protein
LGAPINSANTFGDTSSPTSSTTSSGASFTSASPTSHGNNIGVTAAACRAANHFGNNRRNRPNAPANPGGKQFRIIVNPFARVSRAPELSRTNRKHASRTAAKSSSSLAPRPGVNSRSMTDANALRNALSTIDVLYDGLGVLGPARSRRKSLGVVCPRSEDDAAGDVLDFRRRLSVRTRGRA